MGTTDTGEKLAWELLAECDPADVCRRARVEYDQGAGLYRLVSFGCPFTVDPVNRVLANGTPEGEIFLKRLAYFFRLSVLWHLVKARDIPLAGRLEKPEGLPGGDIYFKGSHVLPLDAVAGKYGRDRDAFLARGAAMGGKPVSYGDGAVELTGLPRMPTTVLLWTADDEFPARVDLLFDASAPQQAPLDIVWSVAMMSLLAFL
jgi:hypothetical protein